ncbi:E3 ubiquitin-protein ligase CCNP1IP1 [Cladophialophora carrionii]|uniref:E3 ubiquitin-protein ligase CCNP1IP1 n=1 Tax=Cladophialophora carrionii TaxID=86049 RepID=A0A1C1C841_9EURO|nr:E3 ubiquitin-protein ligase CCNP1IP1 [Cladophialophora carrionii]
MPVFSVWVFDLTPDSAYQQYIAKRQMQKCQQLRSEADKIAHDANLRIQALEAQVQARTVADISTDLISDRQSMYQKYADLNSQFQEKCKKQQQTQRLYDAIKQKVLLERMGAAANNDVDHTLDSIRVIPSLDKVQHGRESRQGFRASEHRDTAERVVPHTRTMPAELERLHPHQRSGASVAGSQGERMKMPPPGETRSSKTRMYSTTPMAVADSSSKLGHLGHAFAQSNLTS